MSRLTQDGTVELVSRNQILRREQRGQGNDKMPIFHVQLTPSRIVNLITYPVARYSCHMMCDHTVN